MQSCVLISGLCPNVRQALDFLLMNCSEVLEEYFERFQDVKIGLARAISKILGFEECYIEKLFNLTSGFDVAAMNVYPPNFQSKGSIGVPSHTDPGFFVSLIQDVDGGLRVLSHKGKWINVHIPRNAFLIQIGDHLEVTQVLCDTIFFSWPLPKS